MPHRVTPRSGSKRDCTNPLSPGLTSLHQWCTSERVVPAHHEECCLLVLVDCTLPYVHDQVALTRRTRAPQRIQIIRIKRQAANHRPDLLLPALVDEGSVQESLQRSDSSGALLWGRAIRRRAWGARWLSVEKITERIWARAHVRAAEAQYAHLVIVALHGKGQRPSSIRAALRYRGERRSIQSGRRRCAARQLSFGKQLRKMDRPGGVPPAVWSKLRSNTRFARICAAA